MNFDINQLVLPIEKIIHTCLLPAWTGKSSPNAEERSLFALPIWLGGLGVINPVRSASFEYTASVKVTSSLSQAIVNQQHEYTYEVVNKQWRAKEAVKIEKRERAEATAAALKSVLPAICRRP